MSPAVREMPHHTPGSAFRPSLPDVALVIAYAGLAVVLGLDAGQDLNWDLLNYHFYNAYMLLDGRIARDVHAAGVQSFHNPLIDLPFYAAVRLHVAPRAFFLALAALHGLALFLVHRIAMLIVPVTTTAAASLVGVLAAVTAAFGAGFRSELGNTMHDNTLAVLVLAALWVIVTQSGSATQPSFRAIAGAGLLAGAATGMKLTVAPLCIGLGACVLAMPGPIRTRAARATVVAAAGAGGVLLTGGYWMWVMYRQFGSPLFPFYNTVFASPFAPLQNFSDPRFFPTNTTETLFYPFFWISLQGRVTEPLFRDGRLAAAFLCLAVLGVYELLRKAVNRTSSEQGDRLPRPLVLVAIFWLVSYVVWLKMFSIYRYVIVLELLSAVLIAGAAGVVASGWTKRFALALPICLALSLGAVTPDWGRTAWSDSYFGVDTAALKKYDGATLLMWDFPLGYLPPHFPRSSTFVRVISNWGLTEDTLMWDRLTRAIAAAPPGTMYLLDTEPGWVHEQQVPLLQKLGLERVEASCEPHASHAGGFRICALQPLAP